jgi:hypothetical protein
MVLRISDYCRAYQVVVRWATIPYPTFMHGNGKTFAQYPTGPRNMASQIKRPTSGFPHASTNWVVPLR